MKKGRIAAILLFCLLLAGCRQVVPTPSTEPVQNITPGVTENIFDTEPSTQPTETTAAPTEPSTQATEPATQPTEPSTQPTEPAAQPTEPSTQPTEPATQPTEPTTQPPTEPSAEDPLVAQYETFLAMSPDAQMKYMQSFSSIEAFFTWHNAAKEAYEDANPSIEIGGDGSVDLDQILGGK